MATATFQRNGTAAPPQTERQDLADDRPQTAGYRPTLPLWAFLGANGVPLFFALRDVEQMLYHPYVVTCSSYYKSGVANTEFDIKADSSEVGQFVYKMIDKFWNLGVPKLQIGWDYGWMGCESMYEESSGVMEWSHFLDFSPRDTWVLTNEYEYWGVRVKNIRGKGFVDLRGETESEPAKGFWYGHRARFQQWYGGTQLMGAWLPWRRLAVMDGAEFIIDQAIYRYGVGGLIVRFPPRAFRRTQNQPSSSPLFQDARSMAQQLVEQFKSGGGIALPSTKYTPEQGGDYMWDVDIPTAVINVSGLLEYIKYLQDQIALGVGIAPEIIQASEVGSGYSGRAIPLESFLLSMQQHADTMLQCFLEQVLKPLVRYNFGERKWSASAKSLLKTRLQPQGQGGAKGGAGAPAQGPGQQAGIGGPPQLSINALANEILKLKGHPQRNGFTKLYDRMAQQETWGEYRDKIFAAVRRRGWDKVAEQTIERPWWSAA